MKENTCITILGGHAEEIANKLALPTYPLGYVADQEKSAMYITLLMSLFYLHLRIIYPTLLWKLWHVAFLVLASKWAEYQR